MMTTEEPAVVAVERAAKIDTGEVVLDGDLALPEVAKGLVIFAHGSGSSRHSPRNRHVAEALREKGLGTLLMDLLTRDEEAIDARTRHLRFDIELLARRLVGAHDWAREQPDLAYLPTGYFGASTGAAAALLAATDRPDHVKAIVSRGGRPDLAGPALPEVRSPTLLIVGGHDFAVIQMNESARALLNCEKRLAIVPNATHLFEEPGALEQVSELAADWFAQHLA